MSRIARLLRYMRPYTAETLASVVLMAVVGAMQAFRVLLIKPIVDNVLSPADSPARVLVFTVPRTGLRLDLQRWLPTHFHNAWTVVALALVVSAILKADLRLRGNLAGESGRFWHDY